jgi:fumarate reductase flavoprotein subunit
MMVVEGAGASYMKALTERFYAMNGKIMLNTCATELIRQGSAITGVRAINIDGDTVVINAKAILLATGGYGASEEMRPAGLEGVVFYGASSSTGDGIKMAQAIGAQIHFMDYMKIYPQGLAYPPKEKYNIFGALNRNGISSAIGCKQATDNTGAIYVNLEGNRFINENTDFVSIKEAQLKQTDKRMFLVMDQTGYDNWYEYTSTVLPKELAEQWFNSGALEPILERDASLTAAAVRAGINAEQLARTVRDYNAMVERGRDTSFNRTFMNHKLGSDGMYYVIELKLRTATTLGGVKVTEGFEVVDTSGQVIPGLFAAGEVIGGAHGYESMPSCMNGWSLVSGRISSQQVLAFLKK